MDATKQAQSVWQHHTLLNNEEAEISCWWEIAGRDCTITLEARPAYCDRGNWLAKLHPTGALARDIDYADGWEPGRFYFDLTRAKLEIEAWLEKRGQWVAPEKSE